MWQAFWRDSLGLSSRIGIFDKGMRLRLMFRCVNVYVKRIFIARFEAFWISDFLLPCY